MASVDGRLMVAVLPVDRRLDLGALARAVGGSMADMAEPMQGQRATGDLIGSISPLGQRVRPAIVVDARAIGQARISVSAGRRGPQMELAPADLVRMTAASLAACAA